MDREGFKAWMDARGFWGYLAYIIMVVLQILVAVVPGGPIEMAGGYAFGAVLGTSLFFIGSFIGSLLVFGLVRKFGRPLVEAFFSDKDIRIIKFFENPKKRDILFIILFIIPGSPKDLLCYVAGLTPMKLWFFTIVATFGRLPAVIASAISGSALGEANYVAAAISLGIILVLSGIGVLVYKEIKKMEKREFRKNAISNRNALNEEDRKKWSVQISEKVLDLVKTNNVRQVLIYVSYGSEVDTFGIMERLWKENVDVYCPKVADAQAKRMEFYKISSREDLVAGFKGILEPVDCSKAREYVESLEPGAMIIVPGCSFDKVGYRMGYGGGFYDRYLGTHPELIKVGVCFKAQICESVPTDEHDVKMDYVIWEEN